MTQPTLTTVPGVRAGHWTHPDGTTGVTVVRFDRGARAGHHVPGSAVGSREWGVLEPDHLAGEVHAFCLAGGSAHGLAAADGVMRVLEKDGIGFDTGAGRVPIVPAAILFDLDRGTVRPDAAAGEAATETASTAPLPFGRVGAGAGACVGRGLGAPVPAGVGTTAVRVDAWWVGALAAVNAFGGVHDPMNGEALTHPLAGPLEPPVVPWRGATTLAVIATDAPLTRSQCRVVAKMASAAMARCFRPAFTPFDGDVVLVSSTGAGPAVTPVELVRLGDAAATALGQAITQPFRS